MNLYKNNKKIKKEIKKVTNTKVKRCERTHSNHIVSCYKQCLQATIFYNIIKQYFHICTFRF